MRIKYQNITADGTVTLISKYGYKGITGSRLNSISIANHDDSSDNVINLFLHDGTNTYVILETVVPARTTLVLGPGDIRYDSDTYDLKLTTDDSGGTTAMTIIIK